jgi:hypothetical protein
MLLSTGCRCTFALNAMNAGVSLIVIATDWTHYRESRPLFAFAGIWRLWTGERKGETGEHQLFALLGSQMFNQRRKRIGEIFVFSPSEAVPRHDDAAAKIRVVGIEGCNRPAISRGQKLADDCKACQVESQCVSEYTSQCYSLGGNVQPAGACANSGNAC